ncbi:DUF3048 domain-containing protein [Desmospora profundinema]|uniref:DUF3048 domain-containing protein n=1 Tax=Desmospora profundinema TaxID=1571184 RepID=A0ABU1IM77_9BACL|nr:DUF3048 domain-containing protein [Desmospora profundinema]MDR6225889.1 hypothetical protein [Desmospora profundinema]
MNRRIWTRIGFMLILAVSMVACTSVEEPPSVPDEVREKEEKGTHPYTGELWEGELPTPVMVMVNNQKQARPQSGLHQADWIMEVLAEGEITRLAAFYFRDYDGKVGPVRSLRPYYLDLAEGSGAVVAHAGGSPAAMALLQERNWPHVDGIHRGRASFQRDGSRKAPHNLYTTVGKIRKAGSNGPMETREMNPLLFDPQGAVEEFDPASRIEIRFHRLYEAGFDWDQTEKRYFRRTQGELQRDRESGEVLGVENVIVIRASHRVLDTAGRREVDWTSGGEGMLFQRGLGRPIRWENRDGWLLPVSEDDDVLPLVPGKTWVNVIPDEGTWSYGDY